MYSVGPWDMLKNVCLLKKYDMKFFFSTLLTVAQVKKKGYE